MEMERPECVSPPAFDGATGAKAAAAPVTVPMAKRADKRARRDNNFMGPARVKSPWATNRGPWDKAIKQFVLDAGLSTVR